MPGQPNWGVKPRETPLRREDRATMDSDVCPGRGRAMKRSTNLWDVLAPMDYTPQDAAEYARYPRTSMRITRGLGVDSRSESDNHEPQARPRVPVPLTKEPPARSKVSLCARLALMAGL